MDEGKFDESIKILKACEKVDGEDYAYPYEIALAYTYMGKYKKAIDVLEKIKEYKGIQADYYQLLGNNYDMNAQSDKAIEVYEEGIKLFPNAGALHLEKGIVYESQQKYSDAIINFEKGIMAEPMFASNYYRLSKLYLSSNDKLSGLIYGEIFMNLERTTKRTTEISKLLFECYKNSLLFDKNEKKIDLCEIIVSISDIDSELKMPLCAVYTKHLILAMLNEQEINLESLSKIRIQFIKEFFKEDANKYPNVLFSYHQTLLENNIFDSYNRYLFQMGAETEFNNWMKSNKANYDKFVEWYIDSQNEMKITGDNLFIAK